MTDVRFYAALFWRRVHWFALSVAIFTLGGIAAAILATPVFVASAKLVVESETIPDELATSTVQTQALEHLHIIEQRVLARETLIDMASRMGLGSSKGQSTDELVDDLRDRIEVTISGDTGRIRSEATLLELSVEAENGRAAAALANELVTLVLAEDVSLRTGTARQTLDFFDQEVARLEQELSRRAEAMLAFQQQNPDALNDSLEFRRTRLELLLEQLSALDDRQDEIERNRDRQIRLHESIHGISATAALPSVPGDNATERRRLRNLIAQRDGLPQGDPARAEFDRRIDSLQRILGIDEKTDRRSAYERRLKEYGEELTHLEDRRASLLTEIERLEGSITETPALAVQLAALERDHSNLQAQYDEAVSARAVAETADAIESLSKGQRVSVLEQAVAPQNPSRPNRKMIAATGVGGGIVLGGALVFLMILLTGNLRRPSDLVNGLGITAFATLPFIETAAETRARRLNKIGIMLGSVAVLGLGLGALHAFLVPLDLLMASARTQGPSALPNLIRDAILTSSR
jgi:uncharacterized protein involved in exopolysaccharide biosynthesis